MANTKYDITIQDKYNPKNTVVVDVYQIMDAYGVRNSALAHLIKKALCAGHRGHKDILEDCKDIIDSAVRAEQLETQRQYLQMMDSEPVTSEEEVIRNLPQYTIKNL